MYDTNILVVGIFVTGWMLLFFVGSAIGLRKAHEVPGSTVKGVSNGTR